MWRLAPPGAPQREKIRVQPRTVQCATAAHAGSGRVDGGTGSFAEAVVNVLRDDGLRRRLGEEGRGIVERRYTLERMGQAHLEYYRRLAGKGPPSPGSKPE